jgi:dienelactone hydrolase
MTSSVVRAWLAAIALVASPAHAAEIVVQVPVSTFDTQGHAVNGSIPVTIYRPIGTGRYPVVIVSHGRPGLPGERQRMGRVRLSNVTATLLGLQMVVIIPTRLGYGAAGSSDPEYSVSCEDPQYQRAFAAGADQVGAVVRLARTLDFVDPDRIFLMGHSVGGGVTATAATRHLPGVRAAVNFSGGHGGNLLRPGEPCRADVLQDTFASLGSVHAPVPQLWIYVDNDEYIASRYAKQWFDAFVAAGGHGEFKMVPHRNHAWFARDPIEWRGLVMEFFEKNGLR